MLIIMIFQLNLQTIVQWQDSILALLREIIKSRFHLIVHPFKYLTFNRKELII